MRIPVLGGLLERQAAYVRSITGTPLGWEAPRASGTYGARYGDSGPTSPDLLRLVVLGDSLAAGLGAARPEETVAARAARRLSTHLERPVHLRVVARIGAESADLAQQLRRLGPRYRPDVALVVVGGNDVLHRVPAAAAARHLAEAVRELQSRGAAVVVGTCPDLGALRHVPQPLRVLASLASRRLAVAQRGAVLPLDVEVVDLADVLGSIRVERTAELFAIDRFHPSSAGYVRLARAVLPAVLRAADGSQRTHGSSFTSSQESPPA